MSFNHNPKADDVSLWTKFRQGDTFAFNSIIKMYYNEMFSYGYCFCKDQALLKDAIQDIFLTLWKNRTTLSNTTHVKFYLLKSLRRRVAELMTQKKRVLLQSQESLESLFDFQLTPEDKLIQEETLRNNIEKLRLAIKKLSKRQQEIIYLKFYTEINSDDIGNLLGLSQQSVYNLLHNAINQLRTVTREKINAKVNKPGGLLPLLTVLSALH